MRRTLGLFLVLGSTVVTSGASAGLIATENAKPGMTGSWVASDDGSAAAAGVIDLYPGVARWSIAQGEALPLKVRSTTGFDVEIIRLGWYGGAGGRVVKTITGNSANPQPYPTPDATYGLADPKWATNVTVAATDTTDWTPGLYVARARQPGGKAAVTPFCVRDDKLPTKMPVLLVVGLATHQAYNAWPGPAGSGATSPDDSRWIGKSLYGFNASTAHPSDSIGTLRQAVKVSADRPFLVGGGAADVGGYEYPFVRWVEKNGYEMSCITDQDLHVDPSQLSGRKLVTFSGHEEYVSWEMFDNVLAGRDAGVNFLILSGDTWSWQVRFEPGGGSNVLVGYKESWVKDPVQKEAYALKTAGKIEEAKAKYRRVTRGFKNLELDTAAGIDERRPGMIFTGVQSAGIIRDAAGNPMHGGLYPWADLVVTSSTHWIYEGTGLANGAKIPNVFGYEVDSTLKSDSSFDKWRKPGQIAFGAIKQVSDGVIKGSAAWYKAPSGAEVVAMGAIYTSWALDDWAWKQGSKPPSSLSSSYDRMVKNAFTRLSGGVAPEFDAGPPMEFDAGPVADADDIEKDGGTFTTPDAIATDTAPGADTSVDPDATPSGEDANANADTSPSSVEERGSDEACGCALPGTSNVGSAAPLVALGVALAALRRRR
jgi:hypothetical protein